MYHRPLKFALCKTWEQTGFFVSFFQFNMRQDKDKWQNRWEIYNLGYIFVHYGGKGGGKVFGQFEVRKQLLLHLIRNNCTKHILYADPLYFTPTP